MWEKFHIFAVASPPPSQGCIFIFCWNTLNLESSSIFLLMHQVWAEIGKEECSRKFEQHFKLLHHVGAYMSAYRVVGHVGAYMGATVVYVWNPHCGCMCGCNCVRMWVGATAGLLDCGCHIVKILVEKKEMVALMTYLSPLFPISSTVAEHLVNTKHSWVVCMVCYGMV